VHEKIQRAGGTSRLEVFDGVFHGWQMLSGIMPEANAALQQVAAFVRESRR
jgi:acetyl esterase/lipase